MADDVFDLTHFPAHIGLGARVERLERFDGTPDWYMRYGRAHADDGLEGRLVSMHRFESAWDSWEMHPQGSEVVICTPGAMTLVQEIEGREVKTRLTLGHYAINPPGTWHTADVDGSASAVFITAGMGTQTRPRS